MTRNPENVRRYYEAGARLLRSIGSFEGAFEWEEIAQGGWGMRGRVQQEKPLAPIDLLDAFQALSHAAGLS